MLEYLMVKEEMPSAWVIRTAMENADNFAVK